LKETSLPKNQSDLFFHFDRTLTFDRRTYTWPSHKLFVLTAESVWNGEAREGAKGGRASPNLTPTIFRRGRLAPAECKRTFQQPGLHAPDHAGGAYGVPQPLADFWRYINLYVCRPMYGEGAGCPFPKNLTSAVGPLGPRPSDLRASPLTPNRRIGPSQHDGLDPLCAVCMPLMQELRNDTNHWMTATVQCRRPLDARHTQ